MLGILGTSNECADSDLQNIEKWAKNMKNRDKLTQKYRKENKEVLKYKEWGIKDAWLSIIGYIQFIWNFVDVYLICTPYFHFF